MSGIGDFFSGVGNQIGDAVQAKTGAVLGRWVDQESNAHPIIQDSTQYHTPQLSGKQQATPVGEGAPHSFLSSITANKPLLYGSVGLLALALVLKVAMK